MIVCCSESGEKPWLRALLIAVVALGGCATKTEPTRYYLLSDPSRQMVSGDNQCSIRVGAVAVAPYLQRTHIVLQSGANELVPALQHRWSEPLDAGVARLLSSCLGGNADAAYRANVSIDHLHGSTDGAVVLQAQWSVSGGVAADDEAVRSSVQNPGSGRFSATAPQPRAGYDALVSTQRELVLGLCEDIRAAVRDCS